MPDTYESMSEVRKSLCIPWYRCPIDTETLRRLTHRSDLKGAFQTLGHIALSVITGFAVWYAFNQRLWVVFAVALFAHGTIYSFYGGNAVHELAHGTVFKTKWLNGLFMRLLSLISWYNFHDYKMSHTYHHLYTITVIDGQALNHCWLTRSKASDIPSIAASYPRICLKSETTLTICA